MKKNNDTDTSKDQAVQGNLAKNRFYNRELSVLNFNQRILDEASNMSLPLLERLKFLSIAASNIDEFFMVRIAGLEYQRKHNRPNKSIDNLNASEQISAINKHIASLVQKQHHLWNQLDQELDDHDIHVISNPTEFSSYDKQYIKKTLQEKYSATVQLNLLDSAEAKHELSQFPSKKLCLLLELQHKETQKEQIGYIPVSRQIPRFLTLPRRKTDSEFTQRLAPIEACISIITKELTAGFTIKNQSYIRIIRDSFLDVSENADDLISSFKSALKKRDYGEVVRIKTNPTLSESMKELLIELYEVHPEQIATHHTTLAFADFMQLYRIDRPELKYKPLHSRFPERINDFGGNCFEAIEAKDIVVHHPYESFDVVVQFIRQAALDDSTISIKQTLYRTSADSPIVSALIEAAEAGKEVTVMVELKARFDEATNLQWGQELEAAGARVIYGVQDYKTHCKICIITRKIGDQTRDYVHFGTGNYHPVNATIYSDLSFFTCNEPLCEDAHNIFGFLEGKQTEKSLKKNLNRIALSPYNLRDKLLYLINVEIEYAKAGKPAHIWMKMNSLNDEKLIDALYAASQHGVQVELIIRGICCLKPGIEGLSENIRVRSIVGRFLEHARIYCFGNGSLMPSRNALVFISSADGMPRNMDKRIELLIPIKNPTVHEQILDQIMVSNLRDAKQSWLMQPDGSYARIQHIDDSFSAHEFFISNPSLSGRGSAVRRATITGQAISDINKQKHVAVIDIGSNSVRLVIYDGLKRRPYALYNEKSLCGLAQGMEKTKRLNVNGVTEAFTALKRYQFLIQQHGIKDIFAFATSAVRDAEDGAGFIREIKRRCNIDVRILSGAEESRLASLGVASAVHEANGLVGDLGGGSLELASMSRRAEETLNIHHLEEHLLIQSFESFPVGTLRLQSISNNRKQHAREVIHEHLKQYPLKELLADKVFYAVGGGFRSLAKIYLNSSHHSIRIIEHLEIDAKEMLALSQKIANMPLSRLSKLESTEGISTKRMQTLSYTALIMEYIIRQGQPSKVFFSTHGVREGLLYDQLDLEMQAKDPLKIGTCDMLYLLSPNMGKQWIQYGSELYEWMNPLFSDETHHMSRLRFAACILSNIAWHEHTSYRAESSFHWVLDSQLTGISHWERMFIACCIYHRYKSDIEEDIEDLATTIIDHKWLSRARQIGLSMRFGYQLSGGIWGILPQTTLKKTPKSLILSCGENNTILLDQSVIKRFGRLADSLKLVPKVK